VIEYLIAERASWISETYFSCHAPYIKSTATAVLKSFS